MLTGAQRNHSELVGEGLVRDKTHMVSKEEVKEADNIFDIFDEDDNGYMCEKEFLNGMYSLTGVDDQEEITYVFEQVGRPSRSAAAYPREGVVSALREGGAN